MDNYKALQKITNGYYILTAVKPGEELKTRDKDYIAAGVINWAIQISFDPLQVGVSVEVDSHLNETIDYSERFTLHILSEEQNDWIQKFSGESEISDQKINGIPYRIEDDNVRFDKVIGRIDCQLTNSVRSGDHTLHIGKVVHAEILSEKEPLTTQKRPSPYAGMGS